MRTLREIARVLGNRTVADFTSLRYFSEMTDIMVANGTPPVRQGRKATIFAPSKTSMQSGSAQTLEGGAPNWRIALEVEGKWSNPLMGWTSTADHVETVSRQLYFSSKEEAIAWATKSGIDFEIEEPAVVPKNRPKRFPGYGANFDVNRLKGGKPVGGLRSEQANNKK